MRPLALTLICISLAGCEALQEADCTLLLEPAIRILNIDSTSNTSVLASSGEIIASAGNAYADTVRIAPFYGGWHNLAGEHGAGFYRLDVNVAGYAPWAMTGVRVEDTGCGPKTVDVTAKLQPLFIPPSLTRDTVPRLQTSELAYTWTRVTPSFWKLDIPFTYRNSTADTIYMVNCNEIPKVSLEKQQGAVWQPVLTGVAYPACLSPPVIFPPGVLVRDTFNFFASDPGTNTFPQFTTTAIDGVYRLSWRDLVFHYRNAGGDPIPTVQQLSNAFVVRR